MLSIGVFVVTHDKNNGGHALATVRLGLGSDPVICVADEFPKLVEESDTDLIHAIPATGIVLPGFYPAMRTALEHTGMDYAYCPCLDVNGDAEAEVTLPNSGVTNYGQLVVRRWVLRELGMSANIPDLYRKVISDYRGTDIPHVLCLDVA